MIKKIRILGIDYDVQFSNMDVMGNDSAGQCHNTRTRILIDTHNQSESHQRCVLLHEIIEALNYRLELKLEHNQITSLESSLFQVLRDNPDLVALFDSRQQPC